MQLLTFQIGPHLMAIPAVQVLSVGREGPEPAAAGRAITAGDSVDLAGVLGIAEKKQSQRQVIRMTQAGRSVVLIVDRIMALKSCPDDAIHPWPVLLKPLAIYSGTAVIDGRLFPIIDAGKIKDWRKGWRR